MWLFMMLLLGALTVFMWMNAGKELYLADKSALGSIAVGFFALVAFWGASMLYMTPSPPCPIEAPDVGTHEARITGENDELVQVLVYANDEKPFEESNTKCYLVPEHRVSEEVEYSEKMREIEVKEQYGSRVVSIK